MIHFAAILESGLETYYDIDSHLEMTFIISV